VDAVAVLWGEVGEEMTDYNNGQIWGWNGGKCPVHPESEVNVWLRGESGSFGRFAEYLRWGHNEDDSDIVCFQVTKVHAEPKKIWVNEWSDGGGMAYASEKEARETAGPRLARIAVEYVEKQK
jgi:hypothetical protein